MSTRNNPPASFTRRPRRGNRATRVLLAGATAGALSLGLAGMAAVPASAAPTVLDVAAAEAWTVVSEGDSGANVRTVQHLLNAAGQQVAVDGEFGPQTVAAVTQFQQGAGLTADGIVGSQTWPALVSEVRSGSTGDTVSALQEQLVKTGATVVVDGQFGSQTEAAVRALQESAGLTVDGIVGAQTWPVLVSAGSGGTPDPTNPGETFATLNEDQLSNVRTIIQEGKTAGVPEYGWVIAIATAMQESRLQNLSGGDRDSVGLFQQRPSTGWGTTAELVDPVYASRAFYGASNSPTTNTGLLGIDGWESMSVTEAAQAVQISAFPDAYAQWETLARDAVENEG